MNLQTFKPLGERVLVKEIEKEIKRGAIFLPEEKRQYKGEVLAVGPDVIDLKVGHKVTYSEYDPTTVKGLGDGYMIMKEKHILGFEE